MTNQIQGETLFKGWDGGATVIDNDDKWARTPWMPVESDCATYAVEVLEIESGMTLTWTVETRTRESTTATELFSTPFNTIAVQGISTASNDSDTPAKELVRYRFKTGSGASTTDFVIFRALQPSWHRDR